VSENLDDFFDGFTPKPRGMVRQKPAPQVGDSVDWADVPNGALVRVDPNSGYIWHEVRYLRDGVSRGSIAGVHERSGRGYWYACPSNPNDPEWLSWCHSDILRTIVALGLTGDEYAADMRRLVEIFTIHEALRAMNPLDFLVATGGIAPDSRCFNISEASPLLHAGGWRPGMTPEQAAGCLPK